MKILIDNGHGRDTPGKRSPDGRLREYAYTREIAQRVIDALRGKGYDAQRIVTEEDDISLKERCRRVNAICKQYGPRNVLLVSIHNNAAGSDGKWKKAQGWSAHISLNASLASKTLARSLIKAADEQDLKIRRYSHDQPYWHQNLAICRDTLCATVLTENLFQDNEEEAAYLMSDEGKAAVTALHVNGIIDYLSYTKTVCRSFYGSL